VVLVHPLPLYVSFCLHCLFSDIEDDHLLNATYYSPEAEERHLLEHSSTNLGMMVHNESPTHMDTASSAGNFNQELIQRNLVVL
jgi:hypothetical protein